MVSVWRMRKSGGSLGNRAHHRWRTILCVGEKARQLLDRHAGVNKSVAETAASGSRGASRVASGRSRAADEMGGVRQHRFEDITGGERPSADEEGQEKDEDGGAEQPSVSEQPTQNSHPHTRAVDGESLARVRWSTVNQLTFVLQTVNHDPSPLVKMGWSRQVKGLTSGGALTSPREPEELDHVARVPPANANSGRTRPRRG